MSATSKLKHSRQRWKQKAKRRAEDNRYWRKELERLKRERDAYKQRAKQAEAELRLKPKDRSIIINQKRKYLN
jgi:hypothetical protein